MGSFARWRNHARGERGPVWQTHPAPQALPDVQHTRRTIRYVLLNPCRAGLVADPLAWPYSTHRDAVGLAVPGVRRIEREPERFHRWVSADGTVDVAGTALPVVGWGSASGAQVAGAVGSVCRALPEMLARRGPA
jgi:hypothetical protein